MHSRLQNRAFSMPPLYILLGLLLFSLHAPPCSAANDTLAAGRALAVGDKLLSRNGKFALGFFQPDAGISKSSDNTTSPGWYLGIWFNKIPVFTVVWVANRERPITDQELKLTQLKIIRDGNLAILNNATAESIVWSTHIVNRTKTSMNTSAILLNSGNLVIESPSNVDLWQSFDYPTDVVLPGAKFGWNKVTRLNRIAISKRNLIDPGLGSYSVELDSNGTKGVILRRRNPSVEYWSWTSDKSPTLIPLLESLLDMDKRTKGLIIPAYVRDNSEEYYTYTSSDESSSSFVSIDMSSQIKMNVWSQANQSWQSIYAQPADPCTSYAVGIYVEYVYIVSYR